MHCTDPRSHAIFTTQLTKVFYRNLCLLERYFISWTTDCAWDLIIHHTGFILEPVFKRYCETFWTVSSQTIFWHSLSHTQTHLHVQLECYLTFQGQCVRSWSSPPTHPQQSNTQHSIVKCSAPANVLISDACLLVPSLQAVCSLLCAKLTPLCPILLCHLIIPGSGCPFLIIEVQIQPDDNKHIWSLYAITTLMKLWDKPASIAPCLSLAELKDGQMKHRHLNI